MNRKSNKMSSTTRKINQTNLLNLQLPIPIKQVITAAIIMTIIPLKTMRGMMTGLRYMIATESNTPLTTNIQDENEDIPHNTQHRQKTRHRTSRGPPEPSTANARERLQDGNVVDNEEALVMVRNLLSL